MYPTAEWDHGAGAAVSCFCCGVTCSIWLQYDCVVASVISDSRRNIS